MRQYLLLSFLLASTLAQAQAPASGAEVPKVYRETPEKVNDLVHTKLEARFDYSKSQMNGKTWITVKPHFYTVDSLVLDAKAMDIHQVAMVKNGKNTPLSFKNDGLFLRIKLDRPYKNSERYTVYVDYTAKPDEYDGKGSAAISGAKGMYFINPKGEDKNKPTQIWTQGETEATSVWIPTIDRPNQKTTNEFYLTVPSKYVTLSNGQMISQKANADGTRTDYWKMDLPHAPYLFFIGVGEYAVIRDQYKGKEVSYYVEKEFAPVARKIFGLTPEMMGFFSRATGVEFPWVKYGQIVGRDYVSGAMENTTATLHQESAQQDARELTDGNQWEDVIAHELFHQWFGDYVTTESWSNITLNESFANYSEYLWNEYKYGKDKADEVNFTAMQGYLGNTNDAKKDLVRFHYNTQEDVFDAVSYNKGGRILHMLRNYVGDSAFFKAINLYLTTNKFKSAEAHQLRLAFEEITGKDLNWYWNQWYYGSGHPKLNINYSYDAEGKRAIVTVEQTQAGDKVFRLPVKVAIWNDNKASTQMVWVEHKKDTFYFPAASQPSLINFDADKVLLTQKTENKKLNEYLFQYEHAGNYLDRREAIDAALKNQTDANAVKILQAALNDRHPQLKNMVISRIDMAKPDIRSFAEPALVQIATKETNRPVKAAALQKLGNLKEAKYQSLFLANVNDSSYTVSGNALDALSKVDSAAALAQAKRLAQTTIKGRLATAVTRVMIKSGDESSADIILKNFEAMPLSQAKFEAIPSLAEFLSKVNNTTYFKRGIDDLFAFVEAIPESFRGQVSGFVENQVKSIQKVKNEKGMKEHADYIDSKLAKKSF